MPTISKDDFFELLRKSNILDPSWIEERVAESLSETVSAQDTAVSMVRTGHLTKWQARYLLSGRHLLKINNYILLERTFYDDFVGDRFLANHKKLNRKVSIQFLPASLSSDTTKRENFIRKAGLASDLDHPNLAHVYDIDQHGGRFYVVTEFTEGLAIDSPKLRLCESELAHLVGQAIDGLEHAHERGVVHGCLGSQNLVITAEHQIKIDDLLGSTLSGPSDSTPGDDFKALGRTALSRLESVSCSNSRLKSLIENVESAQDIRQVKGQLLEFSEDSPDDVASAKTVITNETKEVPEPLVENPDASSIASGEPAQTPQTTTAPKKHLKQASNRKFAPSMRMGVAATLGLIILAGILLIASYWIPKSSPANEISRTPVTANTRSDLSDNTQSPPELSDTPETLEPSDSKYEPSNSAYKLASTGPNSLTQEQPIRPETDPDAEWSDSFVPISHDPVAFDLDNSEHSKTSVPANPADPNEIGTANSASTSPQQPDADDHGPFGQSGSAADIPLNTITTATKLCDITSLPGHYFSLKLISGPEISKSKMLLDLKSDHDGDLRRWKVIYRKRESEPGIEIAKLSRHEQETALNFQWLPSASADKKTNYLRNCLLQFSYGPKFEKTFGLRRVIAIPALTLDSDDPQIKVDADADWFPNSNSIVIRVQDLPEEIYGRTYFEEPAFDRKTPLRIFFSDIDYEQLAWALITIDIRNKIKMSATLQVHFANEKPQTATPETLATAYAALAQIANASKIEYTRFKGTPIDTIRKNLRQIGQLKNDSDYTIDMKRQRTKDLKTASEIAVERHKKFGEQLQNTIPKILETPLPVVISYTLGEREIELARTAKK